MTDVPRQWDKAICRRFRRFGREVTPEEIAEHRRKILPLLRLAMASNGYILPDGDLELINFLRRLNGHPEIKDSGPDATPPRPMS